ncbi:MAG: hypothetical protein ACR5LD_11715 [Symbiopectobacterium sp.]
MSFLRKMTIRKVLLMVLMLFPLLLGGMVYRSPPFNQATHYLIVGNTQMEGVNTLTKGAKQSINTAQSA